MKTTDNDPGPELDAFQSLLLRDLIAIPSVNPPGGETPVADYLARRLRALGFAVETPEAAPGRTNVVAKLKGGDGPEIVLSGHLDVVAAVPEQWTSDPFAVRENGDLVHGRGVCDMKGAISAMVTAARNLVAAGGTFNGTLTLLFVADEENATQGTLHYVRSGEKPDTVIIGEPTGMDVCIAHRGVCRYHVDVAGRGGHAARPHEAVNPITIAAHLVDAVDRRNRELSALRHAVLPSPTIVVTMIEGAEQPNTIPSRCRVTIDRRTLPEEDKEFLLAELQAMRDSLPPGESAAVGPAVFSALTHAGHTLPGSGLAERCRRILSRLGVDARIRDFPAGCDQFAFADAGIDCLLVGPGDIAQAHTVDEFVSKSQLALARAFYREFLRERLQWTII